MTRIHSFKPIANRSAEILILGSMPGQASLTAGQYYAHPQNAFWRILSELLRIEATASYNVRVRALKLAQIAVWDVFHSCIRQGSLDSSIETGTQAANDFRKFFRSHRKITEVFFNGAKAEACFKKHVLPEIAGASLNFTRLPSTSPAHASLSFAEKRDAWRLILSRVTPSNLK